MPFINKFGGAAPSRAVAVSGRLVVAGGAISDYTRQNVMEYVTIVTLGNTTDFGDLVEARDGVGGLADGTRGIYCGGQNSSSALLNVIEYITLASVGNTTDFGDLTGAMRWHRGVSSTTRGCFGGGQLVGRTDVIDYITIASTGNATDFGDLTLARYFGPTTCYSDARGIWSGGDDGSGGRGTDTIDYITIASTGNATDFGNLSTTGFTDSGSCTSTTRGICVMGGLID